MVRLHYPRPNSIRLLKGGQIVDPILLTDINNTASGLREEVNTSVCGSHAYMYTNYTITFVVTDALDCNIEIQLTESVQLTTHFAMDINDFFSDDSHITNFINNLCALLNIVDTSRVKVVGVFSGSVAVTAVVSAPNPDSNVTDDTSVADASAAADAAISSGDFSTRLGSIGLGSVIEVNSVYYPLD